MAEGPPYKSAQDVPRGRPTPTQEELDKIKLREEVQLSDDGSGEDPYVKANREAQEKHAGVLRREGHAERTTTPRPATPKPPGT
jgi:hypothetical protein